MAVSSKAELKSARLDERLQEMKAATRGKAISKKSVTYHKAADDGGADAATGTTTAGVMAPTDEQMKRITPFLRSQKTPDQLAVFTTMSANTLPDRDDDQFTSRTIKGFAEMPSPQGSIGKSYMVGHDYTKLPIGRIFGAGTTTVEGAEFLTNEVYIPNTKSNEALIENIDFGVNWAVSVGVMLEQVLCSVCEEKMTSFWGMSVCDAGHLKSAMYDPKETRTDDWGFILEAQEGDSKAVKALGLMDGAKDFYELSQVFLGAQFDAQLDSKSALSAVVKRAGAGSFVMLGQKAAADLPEGLQHINPKVEDALKNFTVTHGPDGEMKWVDEQDLIYTYEPGSSEPLCLGKSAGTSDEEDNQEVEDGTEEHHSAEAGSDEGDSPDAQLGAGDDGSGDHDQVEDGVGSDDGEEAGDRELAAPVAVEDAPQVVELSAKAVMNAAIAAKAAPVLLAAIGQDPGNGLEAVLRTATLELAAKDAQIELMSAKAALGTSYIKTLQGEAVNWFVKAQMLDKDHVQGKGVETSLIEKLLDKCGDDAPLIEGLTKQYRDLAQSRSPKAVRRSSFPADPNVKTADTDDTPEPVRTSTVTRIHGS